MPSSFCLLITVQTRETVFHLAVRSSTALQRLHRRNHKDDDDPLHMLMSCGSPTLQTAFIASPNQVISFPTLAPQS